MSAPLAALAAVWCTPSSSASAEQQQQQQQQEQEPNSDHHPNLRRRRRPSSPKAAPNADDDNAPFLPSRRRVDGEDNPPLTPLETFIVAAFLTVWCGAPYFLTLLGFASLSALLLGHFQASAAGWALFALCFATRLAPRHPETPWPALRRSHLLSLVRRYFDYSVAYEKPLDPQKNYLFASYPHGAYPLAPLLGMSAFESSGWRGEKFYGGAASSVFACPLWHHGMRWLGCVPADRATLLWCLRDERASVGICPGGIAEMFLCATSRAGGGGGGGGGGGLLSSSSVSSSSSSSSFKMSLGWLRRAALDARRRSSGAGRRTSSGGGSSGSDSDGEEDNDHAELLFADERIILLERKGFVALAIEAGVAIVPVFYFGNSALLSFGPAWLERLGRKLRVSLGVMIGDLGLPLPRRVPLMQAVGRPVPVPTTESDGVTPLKRGTAEFERAVEQVHAAFRQELERTFERYKAVYHGKAGGGGGGGKEGGKGGGKPSRKEQRWAGRRLIVH